MVKIYNYLNYREYLQDYYKYQKRTNKNFSLRYFALKAGYAVSSSTLFVSVIKGKRGLSNSLISKFAKGLKLSGNRKEYFELMVRFNQAKNIEEKNDYFQKMAKFRSSKARLIKTEEFEFFSKWYYTAIWAVLGYFKLKKSKPNYKDLAAQLSPSIETNQAERAVDFLEKKGFLKVDKDGYFIQTSPVLSTGPEVQSIQVANFQKEMIDLVLRAFSKFPPDKRDISTLTLNISETGFQQIKDKVVKFRKELLETARIDKGEDRVYQCNFQIFPLSKIK